MSSAILKRITLEIFWPAFDPFLFCVFHNDKYPRANSNMGPAASLAGRSIGQDFARIDGWNMYHGDTVPGFPAHPHRGFETVTVVNDGLIDHADSIGAAGRYGAGDTQWMTAGKGVEHSEMFPLLNEEKPNPIEFFQLWLNLPSKNKLVEPHFTMMWNEDTPIVKEHDANGNEICIRVVAGDIGDEKALPCPPNSWAADRNNHVAIWLIDIPENGEWTLPPAVAGLNRALYFFEGETATLDGNEGAINEAFILKSDAPVPIKNSGARARFLLLQGKPIGEPVEQHGPFVMNTRLELQQAINDYRRTLFGSWSWPRRDQVHDRSKGRFAIHADGTEEVKA